MKTFRIIFVLIVFLFLLNQIKLLSQEIPMVQGEELMYEVSFFGVKLGSIKMVTEGYQTLGKNNVIKVKAYLDSYSGIPFVDLHTIMESWIDGSINFSHKFVSNSKLSNGWYYDQIIFDYPNKSILFDSWNNKKKDRSSVMKTNKKWCDGLSLFSVARKMVHSGKNIKIPTQMDRDTVLTVINFAGKKEVVNIDAVNYPIRTVYFDGKANWTGIYGLSGNFEGWFSDDIAAIPIKAKMKVYVGNVDIELIRWKRSGWWPPKAENR